MAFSSEQLNFFKFSSVVMDEFPVALRQVFVFMWDNRVATTHGVPKWDDSVTVLNIFHTKEGGVKKVPNLNKSYKEWDCTGLFRATLFAQTFALPDGSGGQSMLNKLFVKPRGLSPGTFHPFVISRTGNTDETYALALDQLRLLRNTLCHQSSTQKIDKAAFDNYIFLAKDAFTALGQDTTRIDEIGKLGEEDFPTVRRQQLEDELKREKATAVKFKQLEDHLDKIESQVGDVKTQVEDVGSDVKDVKTEVTHVKTQVGDVGSDVKDVKTEVTDVKTQVEDVGSDVKDVKTEVTDVKTQLQELNAIAVDIKQAMEAVNSKGQGKSLNGNSSQNGQSSTGTDEHDAMNPMIQVWNGVISLEHVPYLAWDILADGDWKSIGRSLGLGEALLNGIESDNNEKYEQCYKMLKTCHQSGKASYENLANVFLQHSLQDIYDNYCVKGHLPPPKITGGEELGNLKAGRVNTKDLQGIASGVERVRKRLGRALNVKDDELDRIIDKDPGKISEQSFQILSKWCQAKGREATYSALAQALHDRTVNMVSVATEFCHA